MLDLDESFTAREVCEGMLTQITLPEVQVLSRLGEWALFSLMPSALYFVFL